MRYLAYGVSLDSDSPLPELATVTAFDDGKSDVKVRLAQAWNTLPNVLEVVQTRALDDGSPWLTIARVTSGYLISEAGVADFFVDKCGREVALVRRELGADELTLRHTLLDWVLALVLCLRGKQVLHASAVITPQGLCAFAGSSGVGKSTLAASFAAAGYAVLSDDCLVLDMIAPDGQVEVTPAYPGLRLWDDSIEALGLGPSVTQCVAGYMSKRRIVVKEAGDISAGENWPIAVIFSLDRLAPSVENQRARIEPLTGTTALMEMVSRSWMCDPTDKAAVLRHFRFFEALVREVPIKKLYIPNDLSRLPEVRDLVLADLAGAQQSC